MGMKQQIQVFMTMEEKQIYDLANCQSQSKKTSQTCQSRQL